MEIGELRDLLPETPSLSSAALISRSASRRASAVAAVGRVELVGDLEHPVGGLRVVLDLGAAALQEVVDLGDAGAEARRGRRRAGGLSIRRIVPVAEPLGDELGDGELGVVGLEGDLLDRALAVDVGDDQLLPVGERRPCRAGA